MLLHSCGGWHVVGGMAIDHTHVAEVARLDVGEAAPPAAKMAVSTRAVKQDIGEEVKQQERKLRARGKGGEEKCEMFCNR